MDPTESTGYRHIEFSQDPRIPLAVASKKILTEGLRLPEEDGETIYPPHMIAKVVVKHGRKQTT